MRRKSLFLITVLVVMAVVGFWVLKTVSPPGPLQVRALSSTKTALPDDFVTHVFSVHNRSASADSYELKLTAPEGWRLINTLAPIHLEREADEKIFITVQIPPATQSGQYILSLTAHSQNDPTITASAQAFVKVQEIERVKLRVPGERLPLSAGQESRYTLRLLNTGNVSATVQLSLLGLPSGWELRLSEETVQLAPAESRELSVIIKAPENAPSGEIKLLLKATTRKGSDEAPLLFIVLPSSLKN